MSSNNIKRPEYVLYCWRRRTQLSGRQQKGALSCISTGTILMFLLIRCWSYSSTLARQTCACRRAKIWFRRRNCLSLGANEFRFPFHL